MTTQRVRSPLPWLGGKYYSAPLIVEAFPSPRRYEVYVDLFGGAAHVLLQKPFFKGHTEIYNDINSDLVNFWMQCRDHAEELEARCRSLPYSRDVYYQYHASLCERQQELEPLERAARWFYVLRSSFSRWEQASSPSGWNASGLKNEAHAYRSALDLFTLVLAKLKGSQYAPL